MRPPAAPSIHRYRSITHADNIAPSLTPKLHFANNRQMPSITHSLPPTPALTVCSVFSTLLALTAFLAFLPVSAVAAPNLNYSAAATYLWTENLGRASGATDFRDTSSIQIDLSAGAGRQLASGLSGELLIEASALAVPEFHRADEATISPRAFLRKKFGLGPDAPVLTLETAALGKLARVSENNGVTLQGALTLSKRFGPLFSAQVRGEWQEHVADSRTFDVQHRGIEGRVNFDPTDRLRFSFGGGYLDGTFTVGASAARFAGALGGALGPDIAAYYAAIPQTVTDVFGPGWIAYRVRGDVDYFYFEFSPALTDHLALSIRYERNHAFNVVEVGYRQDIFSVGAL